MDIKSANETIKDYYNVDITYGIVGQEDAKKALEENLRLLALIDQPQKIIMLEGSQGTGKTTLIEAMCSHFMNQYPGRFTYIKAGISELTEGIHTSKIIDMFWDNLEKTQGHKLLFIDEAEEVLISRLTKGTHIRSERTNTIILKLNKNIPNLLILLASNRPKEIDPAIKGRIMDRIECTLPTPNEMKAIIKLHMPFIDENKRDILLKYIEESDQLFNGRDMFLLSQKILTKIALNRIEGKPEILNDEEICKAFYHIEQTKRKLDIDYLEVRV